MEIDKELERSYKSLKSAELLFQEKLYEDCISRCYYSILHAAKAALLSLNISVDSHDAVKKLFSLHLIKSGKINEEFGTILREEQDDRLSADYDVLFNPSDDLVFKRLEDAREFINEINKFLNK
jgi:uncharacterized protein (UPF0332 family)